MADGAEDRRTYPVTTARSMADLKRDLAFWQAALGLQHWRIALKRGKHVDHEPEPFSAEIAGDSVAHCWWTVESPNAVIAMIRGEGMHTLVHELLHIRLEGHRQSPRKYDAHYERAINHLTEALLAQADLLG